MPASPADPTLLITRPAAAGRRFAAQAAARLGPLPVLLAPLIAVEPLAVTPPPGPFDAVIFSAEPAVAAVAGHVPAGMAAWCVGARSAAAARAAGFVPAGTAPDAAALGEMLAKLPAGTRLLHARGEHVASDFPARLGPAGIVLAEAVVYAQRALPLPDEARALLARPGPVLLPLFSPRSARLLADAVGVPAARLFVAALSPAVAMAAEPLRPARVEIAARPEAAALLDGLARLLDGIRLAPDPAAGEA